jgi:hypothetical protein
MPAPSYPRGMPAPFRPTHRVTVWRGPGNAEELACTLDGDRLSGPYGGTKAERDAEGRWHWCGDGPPITALEVRGLPGRRTRSDVPATEDVRVLLHHGYVTLHLTEDERAQLRGAAGETDFAEWARSVVGKRRLGPAKVRDLLLEKAVE